MTLPVTCRRCLFQVAIGLHLGNLTSFSPDQAKMMERCKRAEEPDFAYDCPDLTSALLTTLENEARRSAPGLRHGADDAGAPDKLSAARNES